MKSIYQEKVTDMMQNYEDIKKTFLWENDLGKHLVALTYTMKEKKINIEEIKDMKSYIKSQTGLLSPFRGYMIFVLSGLLCATSDNPREQFDFMLNNEKLLKNIGFKSSTYLPTALYALSSAYKGEDVNAYVDKAMVIYKEMKKNHPFLTSGDDYALAILLANTDHNIEVLEEYYKGLNNQGFNKSNGTQMLSHIVAFSKRDVDETINRCVDIYNYLKENKLKIYSNYYPAIGIMSLLDDDNYELKSDLVEVSTFLKNQKKYKWLGKGMNVLMSSSLIASEYIKEKSNRDVVDTSLSVSIQAIIAAQQAAMITAITASTAAASSSSS